MREVTKVMGGGVGPVLNRISPLLYRGVVVQTSGGAETQTVFGRNPAPAGTPTHLLHLLLRIGNREFPKLLK